MKKNTLLMSLFTAMLMFGSCSKEAKLKSEFMDRVWVIDSIKSKSSDLLNGKNKSSLRSWNNVLKPIKDSIFDIYQDQTCQFDSFKISNDTLFIVINGTNERIPFRYEKVNNYTSKLVALNHKFDKYEYYITDLTDLFNGKVNNDSKLFNQIKDFTWYPIKGYKMGEKVIDNESPEFYTKEDAFQINENRLKYSSIFDKKSLIKMTEKGIYFFDSKKKELTNVYKIKTKANKLQIFENNLNAITIDFKKIESSILINEKDVPKKVRLQCSESLARYSLENQISSNNSSFYFDNNSIKLINENENDCEYTYTIVYQSKNYSDINSTKTIMVTFTEDKNINFKFIQ
jgi:hypothetical protein